MSGFVGLFSPYLLRISACRLSSSSRLSLCCIFNSVRFRSYCLLSLFNLIIQKKTKFNLMNTSNQYNQSLIYLLFKHERSVLRQQTQIAIITIITINTTPPTLRPIIRACFSVSIIAYVLSI